MAAPVAEPVRSPPRPAPASPPVDSAADAPDALDRGEQRFRLNGVTWQQYVALGEIFFESHPDRTSDVYSRQYDHA